MNHLAQETSPYLLQHANNPIDWYPWGEEAFALARTQGKPVFLSIGYASCHWCHVMAHESFEDEVVAEILNREYVSIKVDREERPDIDAVYIEFCTLMTGNAGWPTTVFLTPDKDPLLAATYIPKDNAHGKMGLVSLLNFVAQKWKSSRRELEENARGITAQAQNLIALPDPLGMPKRVVERAYEDLYERFDPDNGGFGKEGPKFPMAHNVRFLLRFLQRESLLDVHHIVNATLDAMCGKGLFDHINGGFYRYTVDSAWQTPHYEKMLSDNALMAQAYAEAAVVLDDPLYREVALSTLAFIERAFLLPDGTFASNLDADYRGEEGGYYRWSADEVAAVLTDDAPRFMTEFCLDAEKGGVPVPAEGAAYYRHPERAKFGRACLDKLACAQSRFKTEPLSRDDKVVTWINALAVAAFAEAGRLFDNEALVARAAKAYDALIGANTMGTPWAQRVIGCSCKGKQTRTVVLKDYAYLLEAALRLFEATKDKRYLTDALELTQEMIERFRRPDGALYQFDKDGEELPLDIARAADGALPSGASQAAYALELLAIADPTSDARALVDEVYESFSGAVHVNPGAYPWLFAAYFLKELAEMGTFKQEF